MARTAYLVVFAREKWWIDISGHSIGPFFDKEAAMLDAIQMVKASKDPLEIEVWAPDEGGKNRVIWRGFPRE